MFIISLPNDLAVGAVFETFEAADATAKRLGLVKYEITEQHATQPYMTDLEAKETVNDLRETAERDVESLKARIAQLHEDYRVDPWEDTAAQIKRLETRLVVRGLEAAALAIAVRKF